MEATQIRGKIWLYLYTNDHTVSEILIRMKNKLLILSARVNSKKISIMDFDQENN